MLKLIQEIKDEDKFCVTFVNTSVVSTSIRKLEFKMEHTLEAFKETKTGLGVLRWS